MSIPFICLERAPRFESFLSLITYSFFIPVNGKMLEWIDWEIEFINDISVRFFLLIDLELSVKEIEVKPKETEKKE